MQRLTFVNASGNDITFHNYPPYIFWKIQGLEIPPVTYISTQTSGQHGYSLHDILLDERVVKLSCHVHGNKGLEHMYAMRRALNAVCNPLFGVGTLIYANDHGTWKTPAFCKSNTYADKLRNFQTLDVQFECPQAFWFSAEPIPFNMGYVDGGLIWPIETPNFWGTVGYLATVDNDGDMEAPFEMYMDGGSLNPVITNVTTGKFIKVDRKIASYDRLYVNTNPEQLTVSLMTVDTSTNEPVTIDAYGYLSPNSDLFSFAVGKNQLTFNTDDENREVKIRGTFYKRYVGV